MGKVAFIFSGQGGQYSGMGNDLYENSPAAREIFDVSERLRPDTLRQCFEGTAEELKETKNTQPDIYTVSLAAAAALESAGVRADVLAGFSVGEITALTFSGAVDRETGFDLVTRRGALMQAAGEERPGVMAAVFKLERAQVEALAAAYENVFPVNYNCPGQIVVSGAPDELEMFKADVKDAGGKAVQLKVSGSFHTPFMASAAAGFEKILTDVNIEPPRIPLYANRTGRPYEGSFKELLVEQVINPVLWQDIMEHMIASGVDTFIECGPGKTLSGFVDRLSADVAIYNVEDMASLEETLKGVAQC